MSATTSKNPFRYLFLLVLVNVLWSTTFAVNKYLLADQIGVPSLAFVRHAIAGLTVLAVVIAFKIPFPKGWDFIRSCVLGLMVHAGAIPVEYYGTRLTTASNVSVLISTEAAQCVILGAILLGEEITRRKVIGFCLSLGGAGLVIWKDLGRSTLLSATTVQGDLLVLGAAFLYALYTVRAKSLVERCHPYSVFAVASLFASSLLVLWAFPELKANPPWGYSLRLWWWVFYLAVPCLAIPVVVYFGILQHLSAGAAGTSLFLQPVLGVLCAALFLGERIEGRLVAAGLVILLGLYMTLAAEHAEKVRALERVEVPQEG